MSRDRSYSYYALAVGFGILVTCIFGLFFWKFTVDDAFISLRYADHLSSGSGLVFNVGERVEGFSNPLFVGLEAFLGLLGGDLVYCSKLTSLLSAMGLIFLLARMLYQLEVPQKFGSLIVVGFSCLPGIHAYATTGMETTLYCVAVALMVWIPVAKLRSPIQGILLFISFLTVTTLRPEGIAVALLVTAAYLYTERTLVSVVWMGLAVSVVVGLLGLRYYYFGSIVPNTYLAKPSPGVSLKSLAVTFNSLRPDNIARVAMISGVLMAPMFRYSWPLIMRTSFAAVLAGTIFTIYAQSDWMPEARYALPYFVPLILYCLAAMRHRTMTQTTYRILVAGIGIWCLVGLTASILLLRGLTTGTMSPAFDGRTYQEMGKWLGAHSKRGDLLLAHEIGAIGYYSNVTVIDHEGLVTDSVARIIKRAGGYGFIRSGDSAAAEEEVVRYCLLRNPTLYLVRTRHPWSIAENGTILLLDAEEPIQQRILDLVRRRATVEHVFKLRTFSNGDDENYVLLRLKPDLTGS